MSAKTCADFLGCLREARIVPDDRVADLVHQFETDDPRTLALAFVRAGMLTDWQARFLLTGRSRLRLGNYLLQDRLKRDDLGDHFLAWHEPLHRRVELQVLPEELSRQSARFGAFIEAASRLTRLDHPRLEHVYDVDQEGGRYYVVGEHVPGQIVRPAGFGDLSRVAAGRLLHDISAALDFLHRQSLAHGQLAGDAIRLDETEHGKVVGLAAAVLQREILARDTRSLSELQIADRAAWTEWARKIVLRQFGGNEFLSWRDGIEQFNDEPESLGNFARLVASWLRTHDTVGEHTDLNLLADQAPVSAPAELPAPTPPESQRSGSDRVHSRSQRGNKPFASEKTRGQPKPVAQAAAAAKRLYVTGLTVLVVLGFIGYFGYRSWQARQVSGANSRGNSDLLEGGASSGFSKPASDRTRPKKRSSRTQNEPPSADPANTLTTATASENQSELDSPQQPAESEAPSNQAKTTRLPSDPVLNELSPGDVGSAAPEQSSLKSDPQPANSPAQSNVPADTPAMNQEKDPFQIPGRNDGSAASGGSGGGSQTIAPAADSKPPAMTGSPGSSGSTGQPPFSDFPDRVSLALPEVKADLTLGRIYLSEPASLDLDLIYDPEKVSRARTHFSIVRQSPAAVWTISAGRRAEEPAVEPVGQFAWDNGALIFRWSPEVDARSLGAAMINCFLRLSTTSGDSKLVALREPLLITGFVLEPRTLAIELSLDLPALPQEDHIRFELGPFPRGTPWEEGSVGNELFERKMPALILFKAVPEEQAFAIAIQRDFKSKLEISAQWVALSGDRPRALRKNEFVSVLDGLTANYAQLVAASEQAGVDAENAPYGTRTAARKRADQVKADMNDAKKANELGNFYRDKLETIAASEIPLRIFYETDGQLLVLAKTPTHDAVEVAPPQERRKREDRD